jgi:hypothetical protein
MRYVMNEYLPGGSLSGPGRETYFEILILL